MHQKNEKGTEYLWVATTRKRGQRVHDGPASCEAVLVARRNRDVLGCDDNSVSCTLPQALFRHAQQAIFVYVFELTLAQTHQTNQKRTSQYSSLRISPSPENPTPTTVPTYPPIPTWALPSFSSPQVATSSVGSRYF